MMSFCRVCVYSECLYLPTNSKGCLYSGFKIMAQDCREREGLSGVAKGGGENLEAFWAWGQRQSAIHLEILMPM